MKYKLIILMIFLGTLHKTRAQYSLISDTSVVFFQIKSFLKKDLKDTVGFKIAMIKHRNLIDSTNNNFGVFAFIKLSSEPGPFIYLRNYFEKNITIITNYHIDSVLKHLSAYFEGNKKHFTYFQRLVCTKRVLEILEAKLN